MHFLDTRRREAALAEVGLLAADEPRETPVNLRSPAAKPPKFRRCLIKGSLSCTLAKLASAARNAFASSPKAEASSPKAEAPATSR
jgi:hypothetical protein